MHHQSRDGQHQQQLGYTRTWSCLTWLSHVWLRHQAATPASHPAAPAAEKDRRAWGSYRGRARSQLSQSSPSEQPRFLPRRQMKSQLQIQQKSHHHCHSTGPTILSEMSGHLFPSGHRDSSCRDRASCKCRSSKQSDVPMRQQTIAASSTGMAGAAYCAHLQQLCSFQLQPGKLAPLWSVKNSGLTGQCQKDRCLAQAETAGLHTLEIQCSSSARISAGRSSKGATSAPAGVAVFIAVFRGLIQQQLYRRAAPRGSSVLKQP
jgi:hypothetical protein